MRPSTGPAARTHNSRIARQQAVAARMAPQDASPMRLYSAMADVAPFLFIVFQRGELLAVFQFHGARVLGKRSSPAAFRVLFSFRCTGPLYLPVPVCSWKHLETRRGVLLTRLDNDNERMKTQR